MLVTISKSFMTREWFLKASLINKKCVGYENKTHFYFISSWRNCGTELTRSAGGYKYTNRIIVSANGVERNFFTFFCMQKSSFKFKGVYSIRRKVGGSGILMQIASSGGRLYPEKKSKILHLQQDRMDISISSQVAKRYAIRIVLNWCVLTETKSIELGNQTKHVLFEKG